MYQAKYLLALVPIRYWIGPLILTIFIGGLPLLIWQFDIAGQALQSKSINVRLENTRWQRYLGLLSRSSLAELTQSSSRTSLEVALREAAQTLQQKSEMQIDAFTVRPGEEVQVSDDLESVLKPIRIGFEATLHHAPALLEIIAELAAEASWRVIEVRGCAMQRLVSEARLAAACTIDIYHWSWTTTNNMEM